MLTGAMKRSKLSIALVALLAIAMMMGFTGFVGVDKAFAVTDLVVKEDGTTVATLTAAQIDAITGSGNWTYSSLNNFGTKKFYSTKGTPLNNIATYCGIDFDEVGSIEIKDSTGYTKSFSKAQLFPSTSLFYYPYLVEGYTTDWEVVPTILATAYKEAKKDYTGLSTTDCLRLFRGQAALNDVNSADLVKSVAEVNFIPAP